MQIENGSNQPGNLAFWHVAGGGAREAELFPSPATHHMLKSQVTWLEGNQSFFKCTQITLITILIIIAIIEYYRYIYECLY